VSVERFRGVRIFDITEPQEPEAGRGRADLPRLAHPHARAEKSDPNLYVYGSGTSQRAVGRTSSPAARATKEDPNTSLFSIDVIKVPLKNPEKAAIVSRRAHLRRRHDRRHRRLWKGGAITAPGTQSAGRPTSATTSPSSPSTGSPPAPARATAS
jgi:hypothetical protein